MSAAVVRGTESRPPCPRCRRRHAAARPCAAMRPDALERLWDRAEALARRVAILGYGDADREERA